MEVYEYYNTLIWFVVVPTTYLERNESIPIP